MERAEFKERMKALKAYKDKTGKGYWDWRNSLPSNLKNTNDFEYDMQGAYEAGLQPEWDEEDQSYHLRSRHPKTGEILKRSHHPTYWKALEKDARAGYNTKFIGSKTYTWSDKDGVFIPWKVQAFDDGGDVEKPAYIGRTDQDHYGNLTHTIQVRLNKDTVDFGMPEIEITPTNNSSLSFRNYDKSVARNVADVVSFIPGVGEVLDVTTAAIDASKGNYSTAAGLGLGLLIPNVIEKPAKWLWKSGKGFVKNLLKNKTKNVPDFNIEFEPMKPDPMSLGAKPISSEKKYNSFLEDEYLDYGTVQTEPDLFKPVPDWMQDVIEFYNKDVATREYKYIKNNYNKFIPLQRYKQTFNETNPINVIEPIGDTDFGGYFGSDGTVILRNPKKDSKNFDPDIVVVHEGAHKDQSEYFNNLKDNGSEAELMVAKMRNITEPQYVSDRTYPIDQKKLLNDAYHFHGKLKFPLHYLMEKGASNREMRYVLWKENGKPNVEELNRIIDGMSDDDLAYMLASENGYTKSFWKYIKQNVDIQDRPAEFNKIRNALKYVPFLTIPMLLNAMEEQE